MNNIFVELNWLATSHGLGPFNPAIENAHTGEIWFWPNIVIDNEQEACDRAQASLDRAAELAKEHVHAWNIQEA